MYSFIKNKSIKRVTSLLLAMLLLLPFIPNVSNVAYASNQVEGFSLEGLEASWDLELGKQEQQYEAAHKQLEGQLDTGYIKPAEVTAQGNSINASIIRNPASAIGLPSYARTLVLTLKNTSDKTQSLSFDYNLVLDNAQVTIDGKGVTSDGTFKKSLNAGDSLVIKATSKAEASEKSQVNLSNIVLGEVEMTTVTFKAPERGSYSVDGQEVTEDITLTKPYSEGFKLKANNTDTLRLLKWENNGETISTESETTVYVKDGGVVSGKFGGEQYFSVGTETFENINDAIKYAQNNTNKVINLIKDYTLEENVTIPKGITLLIPFDDRNTLYRDTPGKGEQSSKNPPKEFRRLTVAENVSINVEGEISVSAKLTTASSLGSVSGPYGAIELKDNSKITVQNGASLYTWGYIFGSGSVDVKNGGRTFEAIQIGDLKGIRVFQNIVGNKNRVFPFLQYYVQNIEVPLTYEYGASGFVRSAIKLSRWSIQLSPSVEFIGSNDSLFRLKEGSKITKTYHPDVDRISFDLYGDASLESLSVGFSTINISSKDYELPINNNYSLNIHSGTTTINGGIAFLPGSEIRIDKDAKVILEEGHNAYVYDSDDWDIYVSKYGRGFTYAPVEYSPTRKGQIPSNRFGTVYSNPKGATTARSDKDIKDVMIDINGELVSKGYIFTTNGGANIKSSEKTGKISLVNGSNEAIEQTHQYIHDVNGQTKVDAFRSIDVEPARLKNGQSHVGTGKEYTPTMLSPANTTYVYSVRRDMWVKDEPITVRWLDDAGKDVKAPVVIAINDPLPANPQGPAKETDANFIYTFKEWKEEFKEETNEIIFTPVYDKKENIINIKWLNEDGSLLEEDKNVKFNSLPTYDGETPSKEMTVDKVYIFDKWNPEVVPAKESTEYKATFVSKPRQYEVRWLDENGGLIRADKVDYGTVPTAPQAPAKEGNEKIHYVHDGWDKEIVAVTGDVEYTAKYTAVDNLYDIVWLDEDEETVLKEKLTNVKFGEEPEYDGETPTKERTQEFTYKFAGWKKEVEGNLIKYIATYESTRNKYTVKFLDDTSKVLYQEEVEYGKVPEYKGEKPTKEETKQYKYEFAGWDKEVVAVKEDVEYRAQFTEIIRKYTIKFVNHDGTILQSTEEKYGDTPVYGSRLPRKAQTEYASYKFIGWEPKISKVEGDKTYKVVFQENIFTYTIKWVNADGSLLEEDKEVKHGDLPEYNGKTPAKEMTNEFTYEFIGWDKEVSKATADTTYTAKYKENKRLYNVVWKDENENDLLVEKYEYGQMPEFKGETPTKAENPQNTFIFNGWSPKVDLVTKDVVYISQFKPIIKTYTVRWLDEDGKVLELDQNVPYGDMPTFDKSLPKKASDGDFTYEFNGWTPSIKAVEGNIDYRATYKSEKIIKYNINFDANGGKNSMGQIKSALGEKIALPANKFVREGYYFVGWNTDPEGYGDSYKDKAEIVLDLGDITLYAQWKQKDGWKDEEAGRTYIIDDKKAYYNEWKEIDGKEYFFDENGYVKTGLSDIEEPDKTTNKYLFAKKTGELLDSHTGIYDDGYDKYYLQNGRAVKYKGLVEVINPDGSKDYYYFAEEGRAVRDGYHDVDITNGLDIEEGVYEFDKDGKLIIPVKNGIYAEDGSLYYYENGERTHKGLFEYQGDIYYSNRNGELIHSSNYYVINTNGIKPEGRYDFDENGRLIVPIDSSKKNGVFEEDGGKYYYRNGERYFKGLFEDEGNYYYAGEDGKLVTSTDQVISKHNNLLEVKKYYFDSNGELIFGNNGTGFITKGIVSIGDSLYYYKNNKPYFEGLFTSFGDYYYAKEDGKLVTNALYKVVKHNNLLASGLYMFDANGVLKDYVPGYVLTTGVNVRDAKTSEVVEVVNMGKYFRGHFKGDYFMTKLNGRDVKIYKSFIVVASQERMYIKSPANRRDDLLRKVGIDLPGKAIDVVLLGNYYRYWESGQGVRLVHKSLVSRERVIPYSSPYYVIGDANIRENIGGKVVKVRKAGEKIRGYKVGNFLVFEEDGKLLSVWLKLTIPEKNTKEVKLSATTSVNVRNASTGKVIKVAKKGDQFTGRIIGKYLYARVDGQEAKIYAQYVK